MFDNYETRELIAFTTQLAFVERAPLSERRENAKEFANTLRDAPELVAERVGWLLNGTYGFGSYTRALEVAKNKRMNRAAWLVQTIAALEWGCTQRDCIKAWKRLDDAQKAKLDTLVNHEIEQALSELDAEGVKHDTRQ